MKEPDYRGYYDKYLIGQMTREDIIQEIGCNRNMLDKRFDIIFRERLVKIDSYSLAEFLKKDKEEEPIKNKDFLISDWQTMTEEEKELYL